MEMGDHIFQPGMPPPQANLEADQSTNTQKTQTESKMMRKRGRQGTKNHNLKDHTSYNYKGYHHLK